MGLFSKLVDKATDVAKVINSDDLGQRIDSVVNTVDKKLSDNSLMHGIDKLEHVENLGEVISSVNIGEHGDTIKKAASGVEIDKLYEGDVSGVVGNVAEVVDFKGHGKDINNVVKGTKVLGKIKDTIDLFDF